MNAPTLIVGLGGTGSKIALKVSEMVSEEQKQRIGFAVFDTDVNELSAIRRKNPFVHTIQTSTKLAVGEYLDIDKHARDTWFPVNAILNSKTLTEGAGQVRAVSRLAFETAIRAGKMEDLHRAIEDLYKLEGSEYEQALRVIIVSSLAGGTGSGLILPVGLYIRNYIETHFRQSANIIRGFFILPEVFFEVIKGQSERNNLKSNAYACLRELDAFLMKADNTLPEKYEKTVKIEFPSATSGEYEEYIKRPYDFCFLFDAQNADGKKLNSFEEYMDHAASCIYSQSIGPMNKRSNSSEDNTIRKLTEKLGRNRYAGAGCSILSYPTDDVKKYLAYTWAKNCVSEQWLVYDEDVKAKRKANEQQRKRGARVGEIKTDKSYCDAIETLVKNKDPFSMIIKDSTTKFDESGLIPEGDKWDIFIMELEKKIKDDLSSGQKDLDNQREKVTDAMGSIEVHTLSSDQSDWSSYINAYTELQKYHGIIKKRVGDLALTIALAIFRTDNDKVEDKNPFRLETYLRDDKKDFIHPSAVRYFLYKTREAMRRELASIETRTKGQEDFIEKFEADYIDDPSTSQKETIEMIGMTKKVSFMDKVMKRYSADQSALIAGFSEYQTNCDDYRVDAVLAEVFREGIDYVDELCKSFETFYQTLDSKISGINSKIENIEKKYTWTQGMATRYVCASKKCLTSMAKEMPYMNGAMSIDSDLAKLLYYKNRDYVMAEDKPKDDNYYGKIFDRDLIHYFEESLMEIYGEKINMDVITAIEKEACYEKGITESDKIEIYVKDTFKEAKILSAPFIEKPLGEEKDPIYSCTYNSELDQDDDSPRSRLIKSELKNFGGEPDADVPKNLIMFYKSFYGLRANDLSKFAPPQKTETYSRSSGEYFKAYFELIEKINPDLRKSRAITPHIDRWWHAISMTPDLDDENQEKIENGICAAFFWGILSKYIQRFDDESNENEQIYQLMLDSLGMEDNGKTLLVSNGTPCDRLYEVLDAMYIYPELVSRMLERIEFERSSEVNDNKILEDTMLYKRVSEFVLTEYPLDDDKENVRSIFDIPMLLKKSMVADVYDEEKVLRVLRVEITECEKYIKKFCTSKDYSKIAGDFIKKQFDLFVEDMKIESKSWRNLFSDYLFSRICDIIAVAEEKLGCKKEAAEINEIKASLTK